MRFKACFSAGLLSACHATVAIAQPQIASAIPAEAFAQTAVMISPTLTPDGTHIAYLQPIEGRKHLIMQPLTDASRRVTLGPLSDKSEYDWVHWANNDRLVFVFSFFKDKASRTTRDTRLASINRHGEDLQWLVRAIEDAMPSSSVRSRNRRVSNTQSQNKVVSWLPQEPEHILLTLWERPGQGNAVRKIDVATGHYTTAQTGIADIYHWMSDPSGVVRVGYSYRDNLDEMRIRNSKGKWVSPAGTHWWERDFRPVGFTDEPGVAYMIGPDDSGVSVLRTMRLENGELLDMVLSAGPYDVRSLVNDPVTGKPAGVTFIDDLTRVKYFDPGLDKIQKSLNTALPETSNRIVSMSNDRMQLLVNASSATDPGTYYYWDRRKNMMQAIAATRPGLAPELLSPARPTTYPARDGTAIPAYLIVPQGLEAKDLPAVVLPHEGPDTRSDSSFNYLAHFLASRGYAVLQPNFRGSNGYGRKHGDAGHGQFGGLMLDDITDGARWLINEGIANPDRLCIVGSKYGGYAAAMGATLSPSLYRCAISINGMLDLPALIVKNQYLTIKSAWVDSIGPDHKNLTEVSPYHQARKISAPMLIIQARNYSFIREYHGSSMVKRLRRLGKPVESVRVDFDGHRLISRVPSARLTILQATEKFLAKHIGTGSSDTLQ